MQTEGRRLTLSRRTPHSDLWLVGWLVQPASVAHYRSIHHLTTRQRGVTTFDYTATLHSVNRALHSSAEAMPLAALGPQLDQPRAAAIHSGPPASLSRTSKLHIAYRRSDEASRTSSLHRSQHPSFTSRNPRHQFRRPYPPRSWDLPLTSSASKRTRI